MIPGEQGESVLRLRAKDPTLRSYESIEHADLLRLLQLARADREAYFARYPDWGRLYADRVVCTALCQGAALHYVKGKVGINDFDVYTFYAAHPERRWYAKRLQPVDFGDPKFGRSQVTKPHFLGRRVDLMGRELPIPPGTDPVRALHEYLSSGRTDTARELAQKAVVLLEPTSMMGTVVWPLSKTPSA